MDETVIQTDHIDADMLASLTLAGHQLNIFLKPEHENEARIGSHEYIENYHLPNILIQGSRLVAFTNGNHIPDPAGFFAGDRSYYSYSNICDLFINFRPRFTEGELPQSDCRLMSLSRYRDLRWIRRASNHLVYDGLDCREKGDEIRTLIRQGACFRLSLEIEEDNWICLNVDLPFYLMDDDQFQFQTDIHWYPGFFDSLTSTETEFQAKGFPKASDDQSRQFALDIQTAASCSYLSIYSDGSYDDHNSLKAGRRKSYRRMVLFADRKPV